MGTGVFASTARFYIHDHLYSPVALTDYSGSVLERCEYDAYGKPTIWNADFTTERDNSNYGNPYLFTGRRVDYLDSGSLKIQYNRNRFYDYYTGRWLTHDPLGMVPNSQAMNYFKPDNQYAEGLNLYEYVSNNVVMSFDPHGLTVRKAIDPVCSYRRGYGEQPDQRWVDEWGAGGRPSPLMLLRLQDIWRREFLQSISPQLMALFPNAIRHQAYYLSNRGGERGFPYLRMLRTSGSARKHFVEELGVHAMSAAEELFVDNPTKIVDLEPRRNTVGPLDPDWWLAVQTYYTWGRGIVRKGKGRKSCCYYMNWRQDFKDNYQFEDKDNFGGLVNDHEMWLLNHYKWAQHFRAKGSHTIDITWIKGYRLDHDKDPKQVIEGKLKSFPQCQ